MEQVTSILGPYLEKPGASREVFKFCDSYQTSNLVVHLWIILPQRHPLFGKANYWPRIRLQKDTYLIQRWWCCHCCWTKNKLGKWHLWWKTWKKYQILNCCINWKLLCYVDEGLSGMKCCKIRFNIFFLVFFLVLFQEWFWMYLWLANPIIRQKMHCYFPRKSFGYQWFELNFNEVQKLVKEQ